MKRSRAFSIPSSLTKLKSVKFQEPEMNEEVEFNTPTSFERGPSKKKNRNEMDPSDEATDSPKRKHRKEISNKKNASSSPVSEKASSFRIIEEKENLFAAPNAKLFLVTDEKVQPMTFDEVIQYVSTIRKKDLSVPSSPEGATDSEEQIQKKKTLELIEDIMKEMELFQRVILHRTPGSLSQLLTMKEVEKCLGVSTPRLNVTLSKEDTVAAFIHQIGKRLLQIKVELIHSQNAIRTLRLTQLVNDVAAFLIEGKLINNTLYEDMWPNEDQNFVERSNPNVLKQGVVKEIRSGFKSSKKRGFILSSKTLKIYKDEKFEALKIELDLSSISSLYTNTFNKQVPNSPSIQASPLPNNLQNHSNVDTAFYIVTNKKKYKIGGCDRHEMVKWLLALDRAIMNCGFISKLDLQEKTQLEYYDNNLTQ